jgi:hypothetical protein
VAYLQVSRKFVQSKRKLNNSLNHKDMIHLARRIEVLSEAVQQLRSVLKALGFPTLLVLHSQQVGFCMQA